MPNWCENRLTITGDKKTISEFKKKAVKKQGTKKITDLSLNNLVPMPKILENTTSPSSKPKKSLIKKYGADNWYDWAIKNWGTKWDIEAVLQFDGETCLEYEFDTAWSPAIEWLKSVSKKYPKLYFVLKYDEPSVGFYGITKATNGDIDDNCHNY